MDSGRAPRGASRNDDGVCGPIVGNAQTRLCPLYISHHFSRSCAIGSCATVVCLMRVTDIGVPSETNCNSYFLPSLSTAEQEMPEICRVAKLPTCLQVPVDFSMRGTGMPSAFGRSLEFNIIRSIGS